MAAVVAASAAAAGVVMAVAWHSTMLRLLAPMVVHCHLLRLSCTIRCWQCQELLLVLMQQLARERWRLGQLQACTKTVVPAMQAPLEINSKC